MSPSTRSVFAALIGDLLVAACETVAAVWTGSAAMMSEAIHSFVDITNEVLLLYGIHRSRRKADADHPFGHGREVYFWSFVVSLLIFALGAGVSRPHTAHDAVARLTALGCVRKGDCDPQRLILDRGGSPPRVWAYP